MTPQRLTESNVHAACAEIVAQGERPTAIKLLENLGRGSLTTISKYLQSWHESEQAREIDADNLPASVILPDELTKAGNEALKKIWQIAKRLADADFEKQREISNKAEKELQVKLIDAFKFSEAQALKIETLEDRLTELNAIIEQRQKENEQQTILLKQKDAEIRTLDMQVHKLQASLDLSARSTEEAKADLKATNEKLSETQKKASRLEGQLEAYAVLDKKQSF